MTDDIMNDISMFIKTSKYNNVSNSTATNLDFQRDNNLNTHMITENVYKSNDKSTFPSTSFYQNDDSKFHDEVESIIKKYSNLSEDTSSIKPTIPTADICIEISSDEELPDISEKNKSISKSDDYNLLQGTALFSKQPIQENKETEKNNDCKLSSPKKKFKKNTSDTSEENNNSRQTKKQDIQRTKAIKQAFVISKKNQKPEECIKFMTVLIDNKIVNEKYGCDILNNLQNNDISYQVEPQLLQNLICWKRGVETAYVNDDNELQHTKDVSGTGEVLLIINWKEVVELIHSGSFVTHIQSIKDILINKKLYLCIYGLENYFKYQKSRKRKEIQSEESVSKKCNKYDKIYKDVPQINQKQLEYALTELQLVHSCCYRKLETSGEVGEYVVQITKSIAQAPYKLEKQKQYQKTDWYMSGDNRDCVNVDKNGNGLSRLWKQQVTTFPLANLEHAEAIIAKYPTPISLMKEYDKCSQIEGERLLQDIPIRRAAGPLTTVRKIGLELSKKIYTFFTATDESTFV